MKIVISPAKTLDFSHDRLLDNISMPDFLPQSETLIADLRKLSASDISTLMGISSALGQLNYERFQLWQQPYTTHTARHAVLAFRGEVYRGLDAETFTNEQLLVCNDYLRILSGLYGVLRPLDLILPYRLEMGTKFAPAPYKNLYDYWSAMVTDSLNRQLLADGSDVLVNLASNEYFKVINTKALNAKIITPVFKEQKGNKYQVVAVYAKKARGLMCRFIIDNRLTDVEYIKAFDIDQYAFNPELSNGSQWVFCR